MYAVYTKSDNQFYRSTMSMNISPCLCQVNELTAKGHDCVVVEGESETLLSKFDHLPKIIMEFTGINGY